MRPKHNRAEAPDSELEHKPLGLFGLLTRLLGHRTEPTRSPSTTRERTKVRLRPVPASGEVVSVEPVAGKSSTVRIKLRITAASDNLLWKSYFFNKDDFRALISRRIAAQYAGKIRLEELECHRGSLEIFMVVVGVVAAYPGMKALVCDLIEWLPKLLDALTDFLGEMMAELQPS